MHTRSGDPQVRRTRRFENKALPIPFTELIRDSLISKQVHLILLGKPCSGKSTQATLLSRGFRAPLVSSGNLLRGASRSSSSWSQAVDSKMQEGELLPDAMMLELISRRINERDCERNGWILDGFPRNEAQARMLEQGGHLPDCIVILDRPDEIIMDFALGRCEDSSTGVIYHPKYNPPPEDPDLMSRLVWRMDDDEDTIRRRLEVFQANREAVLKSFPDVPRITVSSARSDLDTFSDICEFVEGVMRKKLDVMEPSSIRALNERIDMRMKDVKVPKLESGKVFTLLDAVERCNRHQLRNYVPVYCSGSQIGFMPAALQEELKLYPGAATCQTNEQGEDAVIVAPFAETLAQRTQVLKGLVDSLVRTNIIPREAVRDELQDVRRFSALSLAEPPLIRLERAALIYFGIPSFGVHVNGFVRGDRGGIKSVWLAVRSASKATYPGLWDQMVAGGQPSNLSFSANVKKECDEEASIPRDILERIKPAGQVSYRYATRKGLSTKILTCYDLEVPSDFVPYNGDGEVDYFFQMSVEEALDSIKTDLHKWKPNCALVQIDFAVRHGYIDPDDPDYVRLCHLLRTGWSESTVQ